MDEEDTESAHQTGAEPDFPIEGDTKWVDSMRSMGWAFAAIVMITAIVFYFLQPESFIETKYLAYTMMGIVFLLLLQYIIFLKLVIPGAANYGRFRVYEDRVELFHLTPLGFGLQEKPEIVLLRKFLGLAVRHYQEKKKQGYAVFLVHSKRGKSVKLQVFPNYTAAESYAYDLAPVLGLGVASKNSGALSATGKDSR